MSVANIVGGAVGLLAGGVVAYQALDFSYCSTYEVQIANPVVRAGDRLLISFLADRIKEGCRVFADYYVFDGVGTQIYSWRRDMKAPGPTGQDIPWTVPLPIAEAATPGQARVDIAISFVKNPIQQILYGVTGWTTTYPPIELEFTIAKETAK